MTKLLAQITLAVALILTACGGSGASVDERGEITGDEVDNGGQVDADVGDSVRVEGVTESEPELSGNSAADIETWLIEVGNDFPDAAKCVAADMEGYSVSDFEKSFAGEYNEVFETRLDEVYEVCEAQLGITSDP